MVETYYVDKEKIVEILKKLGHRVIDVPDSYSNCGSLVIVNGDSEEIVGYISQGILM